VEVSSAAESGITSRRVVSSAAAAAAAALVVAVAVVLVVETAPDAHTSANRRRVHGAGRGRTSAIAVKRWRQLRPRRGLSLSSECCFLGCRAERGGWR
jgi:hypothetical protein